MTDEFREPSGSFRLPPTTAPGVPTGHITLRDILIAGVFLLSGGGGVGILTGNANGGLKDEVASLAIDVKQLTRAVDNLGSETRAADREHEAFRSLDIDHEKRLRDLETKRTR